MSSIIKAEKISLEYNGTTILKNLSFEINEGDYLCVVGENGSGKSTLMKSLLGLKKIADGKIEFNDVKQTEIGYLPQSTDIQKDFPASVEEIVLTGTLNRSKLFPFYSKSQKKIAEEIMNTLHISDIKSECFNSLSGGQQQRVLLARAMCAGKKILVLDEPVSGLDPIITNDMYEIINELNKQHSLTVIMVSHDINSALKYASHILHLRNEPLFFGKTEDYINSGVYKSFPGGDVS